MNLVSIATRRPVGGARNDVFVFNRGDELDLVTDFTDGQDRIDLRSWGFVNFLDLQAKASATNTTDGVEFDFGDGNILTVIGATPPTLGLLRLYLLT